MHKYRLFKHNAISHRKGHDKMCVFEHVTSDKKKKVLAIIPYENIEYVRNYPYSKGD